MQFDAVGRAGIEFELGSMDHLPGEPKPQLALETVRHAAGQDAGPRPQRVATGGEANAVLVDGDLTHADSGADQRARLPGLRREALVEVPAVDGQNLLAPIPIPLDVARLAARRVQAGAANPLEDDILRNLGQLRSLEVQCVGSPITGCSSSRTTSRPASAHRVATSKPAGPPPTIAMSIYRSITVEPVLRIRHLVHRTRSSATSSPAV